MVIYMKNKTSLLLSLLLLSACNDTYVVTNKPYEFKVTEHKIAVQTSEVQEHTHDIYLAYCVAGANECYIEVPVNDTREKLMLVHTGYVITYKFDGIINKTVSNNGWEIYEN